MKQFRYTLKSATIQKLFDDGKTMQELINGRCPYFRPMGLNKGGNQKQDNFILVHNTRIKESNFIKDVGFNLKVRQVLTADGTNDLRNKLKSQIEAYYGLT